MMKSGRSPILYLLSFLLIFLAVPILPNVANANSTSTETQVQYLSGTDKDHTVNWDFYINAGRKSGTWTTIPVPSNWDMQGFGSLNYYTDSDSARTEVGQYKKTFTVPPTWGGEKIYIVFDGSMTDTEVKVNGVLVGPVHQGSFYQFKYDITQFIHSNLAESNLLEVNVSKYSSNPSVNLAERQADFWIFGGIYRPVYLQAVPTESIDRTAINAKADGTFAVDVYTNGITTADAVTAQIQTLNGQNVGSPVTTAISSGATQATITTTVSNPKLWTAETPNLYKVVITLLSHGVEVHKVSDQFGFRTIEIKAGDGVYINGNKIIFSGVSRQAFSSDTGRALSPTLDRQDVLLIKSMNMNAVRSAHYPPDESFLDLCDEMGLYVIDELTGWQKKYDTTVGTKLATEMVVHDVNHPSIIFWANGNEGGTNTAVDPVFPQFDPQQRPVIHPYNGNNGGVFSNINTDHYENYANTVDKITNGNANIFMPTEYLHGLYDGGLGAGLNDYWKYMGDVTKPRSAGGFLWNLSDESVLKADGSYDSAGNSAPDGITSPSPDLKKEGSYYTIKDIFAPTQLTDEEYFKNSFPSGFNGNIGISNQYQFTNLSELKFEWQLINFKSISNPDVGYDTVVQKGVATSPNIEHGQSGNLHVDLPADWTHNDALGIIVKDAAGNMLTSWTWMIKKATDFYKETVPLNSSGTVSAIDDSTNILIATGSTIIKFSKSTGEMTGIQQNGKPISFNKGPILVAGTQTFKDIVLTSVGSDKVVTVNYDGDMKYAKWTVHPSGWVDLEYKYNLNGSFDNMGVSFNYPESKVVGVKWLGKGPYRVYKNRMKGPQFNVWDKSYNTSTHAFEYPEFNGFYSDTYWAVLKTKEGDITMSSKDENLFLRLFNPFFGASPQSATAVMPTGNISFLDGISGIGTKFSTSAASGPEGAKNVAAGDYSRTISFKFDTTNGEPSVPEQPTETFTDVNHALNKKVLSVSQQEDNNPAQNAIDGNTETKWSSGSPSGYPQSLEIDLEAVRTIQKTEVMPQDSRAYRFIIEAKANLNDSYVTIVDQSNNSTTGRAVIANTLATPVEARYVRITLTGANSSYTGGFSTLMEFRVIERVNSTSLVPPVTPVGFQSTAIGSNSVQLNWIGVNGATGYNIYRATSEADVFTKVNTASVTGSTYMYIDTNLESGKTYYYRLTATNAGGQSFPTDMVSATTNLGAGASLIGAAEVFTGKPFSLNFNINSVSESVYQQVYGQDLTIQFDPNSLEFVNAESLMSKLVIVQKKVVSPGKIQILTAALGAGQAVTANGDFLKLTFNPKQVAQTTETSVSVDHVTIANAHGNELQVPGSSFTINILAEPVDVSVLTELIRTAQTKLNAAVEGKFDGQYIIGSKTLLQAAIDQAQATANQAQVTQQQVNQAFTTLTAALSTFDSARITSDLTGDGRVSIGDLAVVASGYGKKSVDVDWNQYKVGDVNKDGLIDIEDLTAVTMSILK